ncbi:DUF2231 domain-containing protein [Vallicoccus soli]|uniref:DUF2231 domain-containing protein n=1 Tax=Vallicoccus soli TaxID=2339232 RepID=A0A3A3Z1I4_9ACTN|nr:DUF2231 domain-containing protein [Vallicoccus soli]RJK98110.1 hypothetical protein D5H78_04045 [Vallicoccus soli]
MFDLVAGLPVHVLVVHLVVVGVPAAVLVSLAAAGAVLARPGAWRWLVPAALAVDAAVLVLAWVAAESGEALQVRLAALGNTLPEIQAHADLGETLQWYVLALLAAVALLAVLRGRAARPAVLAAAALVLVAGVASGVQVVRVGHSGATATWSYVAEG